MHYRKRGKWNLEEIQKFTVGTNHLLVRTTIQNTYLDCNVGYERTGKYIGKPRLTLLKDGYTCRVLSFNLSLQTPSYVSLKKVIKESINQNKESK